MYICDFVLIRLTDFELEAKHKFQIKFRVKFDFSKFQKRIYKLVCGVKLLDCANFCPHRTFRIRTISQNVILVEN